MLFLRKKEKKMQFSSVLDSFYSFNTASAFKDVICLFPCVTLGGRITTPHSTIAFVAALGAGTRTVSHKPSVVA